MLDKLTSPFREFGTVGGLIYFLDQLLSRISARTRAYFYELMIQPIPDKELIPARFIKSLSFRRIEEGQAAVERMPARADIKQARFNQGALCLGMYKQDVLIGYIWFATGQYFEDEVKCTFELHPQDSSVFDFDLYIYPEHRLGLAFVSLWEGANRFLRERGIAYTYSRLSRFNVESRKAHEHLGWKCVGKTVFLKFWGLELMAADIWPYVHLSWSGANRVRLKLRPDALTAAS